MRNLKKVLSLALCLVMLLGMMVVGAGAVETNFPDNDKIGEEYKEAIAVMSALQIFEGDNTGKIDPKGTLTRAGAAKIMTIVMLGKGGANGLANVTTSEFFKDMDKAKWACGFVDYCASVGIIKGDDTGANPNGTLTGIELATMLMRAAGVPEAEGFVGNGWKTKVVAAASKYALSNVTDKVITREEAAKMTLEGLMVSPGGQTTSYVVKKDGEVIYSGSSAVEAYVIADANNVPVETETKREDSLGWKNFGLKKTNSTDALGRPIIAWTANNDVKVDVVSSDAVVTYTEPVKESKIFSDLGVSGVKGQFAKYVVMDEIWVDGVLVAKAAPYKDSVAKGQWGDLTDTATDYNLGKDSDGNAITTVAGYVGSGSNTAYQQAAIIAAGSAGSAVVPGTGYGAKTEIIANGADNHYKMIITHEFLGTVGKPVAAKDGVDRYIPISYYGKGDTAAKSVNYTTEDFSKGDKVIITLKGGEVDTINLAGTQEDVKITKYSAGKSVTVDGSALNLSFTANKNADATGVVDNTAGNTIFSNSYTLYLDSCGNVIGSKATDAAVPSNYAYVVAVQSSGNDLMGGGRAAKAEVILTDGTVAIVDIPIKSNGKYVKPVNTTGTLSVADENVGTPSSRTEIHGWFAYTTNDSDQYTFTALSNAKVAENAAVVAATSQTLTQGSSATIGGKLTTSKTEIHAMTVNGTKTDMTGLVDATLSTATANARNILYTYAKDGKTINAIYAVVDTLPNASSSVDYAYALRGGEAVKDSNGAVGQEWTFAIKGEEVTYVVQNGQTVAENGVYTLTLTGGEVSTATAVPAQTNDTAKTYATAVEVKVVDEKFIVANGVIGDSTAVDETVYLADSFTVYNVEGGAVEADELAVGDKIVLVYTQTGTSTSATFEAAVAFITESAAE